jgi:S1-C subfamily serine protease
MKSPWNTSCPILPALIFPFLALILSCQALPEKPDDRYESLVQTIPYMVRIEDKDGIFRGTGFLVSARGLILTASHVIRYDNPIRVIHNGKLYLAKTVFDDPIADITLARLSLEYPFELGIPCFWVSDSTRTGDTVIVLGERQQGGVVPIRAYMISWTSFHIWPGSYREVMRIYPADPRVRPKPGYSGGPIFNVKKYVIGLFCCIENATDYYYNGIPSSVIISRLQGTELIHELCVVSENRPFPLPGFVYDLRKVSSPQPPLATPLLEMDFQF